MSSPQAPRRNELYNDLQRSRATMASQGERKIPKRLFSFDTLKTVTSKRSESPEGIKESSTHGRTTSRSNLADVHEGHSNELYAQGTTSPIRDRLASASSTRTNTTSEGGHSESSTIGGTPGARRWDTLRHHVVPSAAAAPPPVPAIASNSSASSVNAPSRPSTPKGSRFPRIAFRQVVDHAKEANETRKLGEEILRACQAIRYPQEPLKGKSDKDAQSTLGTGSYLAFMSNTAASSGISVSGVSKRSEAKRRSQSSQSLSSGPLPKETSASIRALHSILHHYSRSPSLDVVTYMPHETHVLSTLLHPFQMPSLSGKWEEERAFAVETFDLIVKTWLPKDEAASAERIVWCCKASLTPANPNRSRILILLRRLLVPGERNRSTISPDCFQTVLHNLFSVHAFLNGPQAGPLFTTEDLELCKDLLDQVLAGSFGDVDESLLEGEFGVLRLPQDSRTSLRRVLFLEALAHCIEHCALSTRVWLLIRVVDEYWPPPDLARTSWSVLQMAAHSRKLHTFCRAGHSLLQAESLTVGDRHAVAQQVVALLDTRIMPEIKLLDQTHSLEVGASVVKLVVECAVRDEAKVVVGWAVTKICQWLNHEDPQWRGNLEKYFQKVMSGSSWPTVLKLFSSMMQLVPDPDRKTLISIALPQLNERLVNDPPLDKNPGLSNLLNSLSRLYPAVFFKPLFLCAVSTKELTVANHLCTVVIYSRYVEDFWVRDVEMIAMALLSDTGGSKDATSWTSASVPWSQARMGQTVLMVEFVNALQRLRRRKESSSTVDATYNSIAKFVGDLENRLTILIESKEKKALIAPSQRMLLCMILREIRLLTRFMKAASWLQRTINWFAEFYVEEDFAGNLEDEVDMAMERIHTMYATAQSGAKIGLQQRRSTMVLASSSNPSTQTTGAPLANDLLDLPAMFEQRKPLIDGLLKGFTSKALKLFVVVSPLLAEVDYCRIAPILWENGLMDTVDASMTASACFLIMQCAEKTPLDTLALIEIDLRSSDDQTRLEAVRKLGILVNWRFQIMTQNVLTDRTHRPFKLARIPLAFVPTDMGTTLYVPSEDVNEAGERSGVPTELKKQLAELGWAEDDQGPVDPQQVWIQTPMSLYPVSQLDRMDLSLSTNPLDVGLGATSPNTSSPSPGRRVPRNKLEAPVEDTGVLRRNSTSGGPVASQKRRAIFVPPLANIFIRLTRLLHDPNFIIASTTRSIILDLMRNDPSLVSRPVMDILAGEHKDIETAVAALASFLHIHQTLPPPMSHTIFNHLMGFLKWSSRQFDMVETLRDYGLILSMLALVTTQVNGMSFREIRRSKMDAFVVPSGALWFPMSAPRGPMFPRGTEEFANPFEDVSPKIIALTVVRISQNSLFLALLKRSGQEVNMIRKGMTRFVLPSLSPETTEPRALELREMMPGEQEKTLGPDSTVDTLSLVLARSHLMLLAQMFRAMSRHLSDRNELATMIDGVNRILCVHGHDIGIVGHSLIALMVATTRFRRLFTSRTAYTLFFPALMKVYTESVQHAGIRQAIEYAVNRFYALHKEAFLYQSLGVVGQMAMFSDIDENAFAESVYTLLISLTKNIIQGADAAGIHNINKSQEREALIVNTAEDKPQTFLAAIKRADATNQLTMLFPDEYEVERLRMDNVVRLLLTVIAHDVSIIRAQHYLRLLRVLAPQLYNASSSARAVLMEGMSALGGIMLKGGTKSRGLDAGLGKGTEAVASLPSTSENHTADQSRIPSDLKAMRLDYLELLLRVGKAGGDVSLKTAQQTLAIVQLIMRDCTAASMSAGISASTNHEADSRQISAFLAAFVRMLVIKDPLPVVKAVCLFLRDLAPILHAYMVTIDLTGVLDTVRELTLIPVYASDPHLSQIVVSEICTAGLAACELAASDNQFNTLLSLPFRPAFIKLLAECVFIQGADVIAEIEKRSPTYGFLAGVVFPLVLELKTDSQLNADGLRTGDRHRAILASAWLRLLFYTMKACQKGLTSGSRKSGGGGSVLGTAGVSAQREKGGAGQGGGSRRRGARVQNAHIRTQVPVIAIGLQIVKVIVIRAEMDVSSSISGIWERLADFLKSILSEGNADFSLRGAAAGWRSASASQAVSPVASPSASPRASLLNPASAVSNANSLFAGFPTSPSHRFSSLSGIESNEAVTPLRKPRVLDYMLWSMLEFLWSYRSPLRLQLRLLTTEKIIALDAQLRSKGLTASDSRSPVSSHPPSPRRRRASSIFIKNRGDRSHRSSPGASPDVSPLLLPTSGSSLSVSHLSPLSLNTPNRQSKGYSPTGSPFLDVQQPMNPRKPGYQVSPITPVNRPFGAPKIIHLGPTSPSALHRHFPTSPSDGFPSATNRNSSGVTGTSGSRVSAFGAGLKAGLGGLAGGGKKKEKEVVESGGGGSGRGSRGGPQVTGSDLLRTTKVRSPKLVEGTYRRIRGVQAVMGYDLFLPLPKQRHLGSPGPGGAEEAEEDEDELDAIRSWTRSEALVTIAEETKILVEEFETWMANASAQDLDAEANDDSDEEDYAPGDQDQGAEATNAPNIQVVDDFGHMYSVGGRRDTRGGNHDSLIGSRISAAPGGDRVQRLHPESVYQPLRRSRVESWQGEGADDGDSINERSSIVIEVDSTFVGESPDPSPHVYGSLH